MHLHAVHTTRTPQGEGCQATTAPTHVAAHEEGRAALYALTAALLLPANCDDSDLLVAALRETHVSQTLDDPPLVRALNALALAARGIDTRGLAEEYAAIFVGGKRAQVDPSASSYCRGSRTGNTLGEVRAALSELGLARRDGIVEMEDHLGMLCETMALLIAGAPGVSPRPLARQRAFFKAHLAHWYRACAHDIRSATGANFFGRVADVMQTFLDVEAEAFAIDGIAARAGQLGREAGEVGHRSAPALSRECAWPNRK